MFRGNDESQKISTPIFLMKSSRALLYRTQREGVGEPKGRHTDRQTGQTDRPILGTYRDRARR